MAIVECSYNAVLARAAVVFDVLEGLEECLDVDLSVYSLQGFKSVCYIR